MCIVHHWSLSVTQKKKLEVAHREFQRDTEHLLYILKRRSQREDSTAENRTYYQGKTTKMVPAFLVNR